MYPVVRVYYNKRGPLPWSIDYGSQHTEQQLRQIIFTGVGGVSREDPTNTDPDRPSAWLEFYRVYVEVNEGRATLWR